MRGGKVKGFLYNAIQSGQGSTTSELCELAKAANVVECKNDQVLRTTIYSSLRSLEKDGVITHTRLVGKREYSYTVTDVPFLPKASEQAETATETSQEQVAESGESPLEG